MNQLYHSVMKVVAPAYQRAVGRELNKMGKSCLFVSYLVG